MGKNNNQQLVSSHLTAEIYLKFAAKGFDAESARSAIKKQVDKHSDLIAFVGQQAKANPLKQRYTIKVTSDWQKNSSPLSLAKWSNEIKQLAKDIMENVAGIKPKECEAKVIDRAAGGAGMKLPIN